MRNLWKWPLSVVLIAVILCCMVLTPQTAYAWKTKTHGYSANLLLNEVKKGYVTVDGKNYTIPQEYREAIEQYPNAFRAGTLGPDFYPDMLTGQSYIHPYDADAGIGVGDWLMELVKGVNSLPKNSNARKEALAFTLGMAIHYAGDMFGHDFINAFAGGAYPAYADVVKDESQDKLYYIIRHMAEESYMDSLIGSRIGSTDVSAPEKFIMNTWIYEGTANAGSAKIYSKYSGGMMYQYKYLVEMRQKLYQYAEKNRYEIWPPVPQIVQYLDKWIEDLDTATYRLIVTFDDIAHDFLTGVKGKSDIQIVTDRLNEWLNNYGKYASPAPDILADIADAFSKSQEWVLKEIGLGDLTEQWKQFKNELISDMILWGLSQAGIDVNHYLNLLKDPKAALEAHGGSTADYEEYMTYMNAFAQDPESFAAFYNTLLMGKLILMGPTNLNEFFHNFDVGSTFSDTTGQIMMDEFYISIETGHDDHNGTDDNVICDVYEGNTRITSKLLDTSGHNDFEIGKWDRFYVELPKKISPANLRVALRIEPHYAGQLISDTWVANDIWITCRCLGVNVLGGQKVLPHKEKFEDLGKRKFLSFSANAADLKYTTALNPTIISFMKSNDNSTQWVNDRNILWSNMLGRRSVLYEVFHGFKPEILLSADQTAFVEGTKATLTGNFSSFWNGITKERRDREYLVQTKDGAVKETRQQACSGTVRIMDVGGQEKQILTGQVNNGIMTVDLSTLAPGTYRLRADYDGDEYNGSAQSNTVTVTVYSAASSHTVTYIVVGGTWADGSTADKAEAVANGASPVQVPTGMIAKHGYTGGDWDANPNGAVITEDRSFTYAFELAPPVLTYTVTYKVVGGTWSDGTTEDITETVASGTTLTRFPTGMLANFGYTGGAWDHNPDGASITGNTKFTYTFESAHIVTYRVVGGTWLDGSTGIKTETVAHGAYPTQIPVAQLGFTGGSWDTDPAGTVITGDTVFTYTYDSIPDYTVTYKVVGGTWSDGTTEDITETVARGTTLTQFPTGMLANFGYAGGAWDHNPDGAAITGDTVFTYTFDAIPVYTVTYRVVNGTWGDGTTANITETVAEGDSPAQIPTGMVAKPGYTRADWNPDPAGAVITGNTVFTYTFDSLASYTVTYKVVSGTWADGSTADKTETVAHGASPANVPTGMQPGSGYTGGAWDTDPVGAIITEDTAFTYTCAKEASISWKVTFKVVNGAWNDGSTADIVVSVTGQEDETLKLTKAQIPAVGSKPNDACKAGGWDVEPDTKTVISADTVYTYTYEPVISYATVYGNGQKWWKGSTGDLIFIVKRSVDDDTTFSRFRSAELDGQTLASSDYTKQSGSLILTIKASRAETLAEGSHSLSIQFSDGVATADFTVDKEGEDFEDVVVPSDTFTFTKKWEGDAEKSIDFVLYKVDGTVYHHTFDKKTVSKTEWKYSALFSDSVACYVIEEPVEGYVTRYENVGVYADITDRCCNGGTIINKRVPMTGDEAPLILWAGLVVLGIAGIGAALAVGRKKKE